MPPSRAVTHADLEPSPKTTGLGSKTDVLLIILTVLVGIFCFVLCLIAEATRSKVTSVASYSREDGESDQCVYNGSGKTPLLCSTIAFFGLATSIFVEHIYLLIAITKSQSPTLLTFDTDSAPAKIFKCTAGFFFIATWTSFAVGEILLLIAITIESSHLKNWSKPRPSCLIVRPGLFSAAGVLALVTVLFVAGLYLTALHAQKVSQAHENFQREILYASARYASPPLSPMHLQAAATQREDPVGRENGGIEEAARVSCATSFGDYSKPVA